MKFEPGKVFENIVSFYVRLPLAQKIALPLLVAGTMAVIIFVSRWANAPEYSVLFSNLEDADASGIVEQLKEKKIGFRLSDGGRSVEITPPSMVHEVRLELASAGLPRGGNKGFELFDKATLGITALAERIQKIRAIQGELERTIQSIDVVKSARVHITEPERSSFVKRDTLPTASVLLKLKLGAELSAPQVKGIANLVAGSVERLTPENVTIMDSQGNLLTQKRDGEDLSDADLTRLDYQRKIEAAYAKRIETMLGEILGIGRAVARVTADIDFNKFEKEEESFDPAGLVTRSERSVEEALGGKSEGGVPGVVSNLTNDTNLLSPPDSGKASSGRRESVKNYEVSRSVSRMANAAGKISKLSVAVLVDGQYSKQTTEEKDADGNVITKDIYKPLPAEMLRKIENLVKQSVGFDTTRGDVVTVENIRFVSESPIETALSAAAPGMLDKSLPWIAPVLFMLLFFFLLVRPLVKFLITPTNSEVDLSRLLPAGIEELEAELEAERGRVSKLPDVEVPAIDIEHLESLLSENSKLVSDNPQQAALLIRYWLNDGQL